MARIRTIKPSFFESEDVAVLPFRARLLWIGLWTHCDDEGRTKDNVRLIKARIWPLDQVTLKDIDEDLVVLADAGRIVRYEADGQRFLEITNWREHQSINKPTPSKFPPPPGVPDSTRRRPVAVPEASGSPPVVVPEDSGQERNGRERKGGDARAREADRPPPNATGSEPPSRCDDHLNDPEPPPCGRCGDRRRARDAWEAEQLRADQLARHRAARARVEAAALAIEACDRCDDLGKLGNGLACHHRPEASPAAAAAARNAAAAARRPATGPPEERLARVVPIRPEET